MNLDRSRKPGVHLQLNRFGIGGVGDGVALIAGGGAPLIPDRPYPTYQENVLADIDRAAKVNGTPTITDQTADGVNVVRWTPQSADQSLGPTAPLATPVAVAAKDAIVLQYRPFAKADGSSPVLLRHALALFSGANVTQGSNIHETNSTLSPSDFRLRTSEPDAANPGAMQQYGVAVQQFMVVGTGATLSAVTGARIKMRGPAGVDQVHDVRRIVHRPNPRTKAAVIFAFDDLYASHYTTAFPLMNGAGFPMAIYGGAYNALVGQPSYMTLAQLKLIRANAGASKRGQICGQAWNTENPAGAGMTDSQLQAELQAMKAWGRANGFDDDMLDGSYFSSVNVSNQVYGPTLIAEHRTVRAIYAGNPLSPPFYHGETWPPSDPLRIRAIDTSARSLAELQSLGAQAIANTGLMVLVYHNDLTTLSDMIAWCQTNAASVDVSTMRDLLFT